MSTAWSTIELAQTLGELTKMGLVEAIVETGQPTRYALTHIGLRDLEEQVAKKAAVRS